MDPYPNLLAALPFLLAGALLAAGRTALTVLPDSSVRRMAGSEDRRERRIARLLDGPTAFLDGLELTRLGCVAAGCILLWNGLLALAPLRILVQSSGAARWAAPIVLFALVVMALDVLCYLLPARIGARFSAAIAPGLAGLCGLCAFLVRPFVALNGALAGLLGGLFGVRRGEVQERVTEEEIRLLVDMGNEKGAIEKSEKDMINNIFEFDDRTVSEVMTHRTDMTAVPLTATLDEITSIALDSGYSRIPVYGDDMDDIEGILYVKDLLCLLGKGDMEFSARNYMRKVLFIPENMPCVDLFTQFKQKKLQIAIAVDEYGGTAGLVSMEDLLESIVGNIQDEYDDEEEELFRISDDCYLIDGTVSIDDVENLFDVTLDAGEESDYDTIGGLLTDLLEGLPGPDEHPTVTLSGVAFTVVLVEERRIARIRAERVPPEPEKKPEKKDRQEKRDKPEKDG